MIRRVARWHRNTVHMVGPQCIDGDTRHDRGVDAARQANHHITESVLMAVVAGGRHEGVIQFSIS